MTTTVLTQNAPDNPLVRTMRSTDAVCVPGKKKSDDEGCCPPPPIKWTLWKSKHGICYVKKDGEPADRGSDERLMTEEGYSSKIFAAMDECNKRKDPQGDPKRYEKNFLKALSWDSPDVCRMMTQLLDVQLPGKPKTLTEFLGLTDKEGRVIPILTVKDPS